MPDNSISSAQQKRLQTLYGQHARHVGDDASDRPARIAFASQRLQRRIGSWSEITAEEARRLIDGLQAELGVKHPPKHPRRAQTARDRRIAGTAGRHDQEHTETVLAGPSAHRRIELALTRLGWSSDRLERFLASPRSPTQGHTEIRTLDDANRVYWALKNLKPDAERKETQTIA